MTPPEIIPAETLQVDDCEPAPILSPRFGFGLLALVAVLAGMHFAWVFVGMPGPSQILITAMEALNV